MGRHCGHHTFVFVKRRTIRVKTPECSLSATGFPHRVLPSPHFLVVSNFGGRTLTRSLAFGLILCRDGAVVVGVFSFSRRTDGGKKLQGIEKREHQRQQPKWQLKTTSFVSMSPLSRSSAPLVLLLILPRSSCWVSSSSSLGRLFSFSPR